MRMKVWWMVIKVFVQENVAKNSSIKGMNCLFKANTLNKLIWLRLISTLSFVMKDSRYASRRKQKIRYPYLCVKWNPLRIRWKNVFNILFLLIFLVIVGSYLLQAFVLKSITDELKHLLLVHIEWQTYNVHCEVINDSLNMCNIRNKQNNNSIVLQLIKLIQFIGFSEFS